MSTKGLEKDFDVGTSQMFYEHLPAFAQFLLTQKLDEFVSEQLQITREVNFPLLRLFEGMPEEQLLELSRQSTIDFLNHAIENKLYDHHLRSLEQWTTNQLPMVSREQVVVEDITLANYIRKKAFMKFMTEYTGDLEKLFELTDEIDRYNLAVEASNFKTYLEIQQDKLNKVNSTLLKHEQQLLEAQEIADMGSFEWDVAQNTYFCTPRLYKIFGVDDTATLMDFLQMVHPSDREKVREGIEQLLSQGGVFEGEFRYGKDKEEKIIWARAVVTFDNGKPAVVNGTVMDVTNKHHMIKRLQRSQELFNQAQALTHIGNWTWELATNKITWSDELYRIYGLEPQSEEVTLETFTGRIHPEDRDKRIEQIQQALATGQAQDYVIRIVLPDKTIRVLSGKGDVLLDENRKPYKMVGTCQDITEEYFLRKQLEEEKLVIKTAADKLLTLNRALEHKNEELLATQNKLEENAAQLDLLNQSLEMKNRELERSNKELTAFSYVASHDLKEPLRKIRMFSNRIQESEYGNLTDKGREFFNKIDASSMRMQKLIDDLLTFSRAHTYTDEFDFVELNRVLEDVKGTYQDAIDSGKLIIEQKALLPVVKGISFQFHQLFENIISNSIKYSREDVSPHIIVNHETIGGAELEMEGADPAKTFHRISLSDNGIGFDQKNERKIFEVFQRLHGKDEYSGTGIGLAICQKIMQNHHGFIYASSELGKGATFFLCFPVEQA